MVSVFLQALSSSSCRPFCRLQDIMCRRSDADSITCLQSCGHLIPSATGDECRRQSQSAHMLMNVSLADSSIHIQLELWYEVLHTVSTESIKTWHYGRKWLLLSSDRKKRYTKSCTELNLSGANLWATPDHLKDIAG